jgi:hypothetical protein
MHDVLLKRIFLVILPFFAFESQTLSSDVEKFQFSDGLGILHHSQLNLYLPAF